MVVFKAICRSFDIEGIMLSDGDVISDDNRPDDVFTNSTYKRIILMKKAISEQKLSEDEVSFMEKSLITDSIPANFSGDQERLPKINEFIAELREIATNGTQVPTFRRKFQETILEIIRKVPIVVQECKLPTDIFNGSEIIDADMITGSAMY